MLSFSVVFVCLQQQTETRIQMIKMVNEFKLTVVHFARPRCRSVHARGFTAGQKNRGKSGLPGHLAVAGLGPRAAGRRWPLGHGGPWAAGLLLAKPVHMDLKTKKPVRRKNKAQQPQRTSIVIAIVFLKQRSVCIMK